MTGKAFCLTLAFFIAACGGDGNTHTPMDGGASDARDGDGPNDVELVVCPFEPTLEFGRNGIVTLPGVTLYRKTVCLTGTKVEYGRWEQGKPMAPRNRLYCSTSPAPCDPFTALAKVHEAMANPEVKAALSQLPTAIYGLDRRNDDDGVYVVRLGVRCVGEIGVGRGFDVGDACEPAAPNCHPIPTAIALFVDRLKELEQQMKNEPHCSGVGSTSGL